jgi:hypothetical protein
MSCRKRKLDVKSDRMQTAKIARRADLKSLAALYLCMNLKSELSLMEASSRRTGKAMAQLRIYLDLKFGLYKRAYAQRQALSRLDNTLKRQRVVSEERGGRSCCKA